MKNSAELWGALRPGIPEVAKLQGGKSVAPMSVCRPERGDHIMLNWMRLRLLRAECFGPWDMNSRRSEWEISQGLKFLAIGKNSWNLGADWLRRLWSARWWTRTTTPTIGGAAGDTQHLHIRGRDITSTPARVHQIACKKNSRNKICRMNYKSDHFLLLEKGN